MTKYLAAAFLAAATILLSMPNCGAANQKYSETPAQARAILHRYYSWFNAPWTGDDQPYAALRAQIEAEATDGKTAIIVMNKYQKLLAKNPIDFQAQFAYYYSVYLAATLPGGLSIFPAEDRLFKFELFLLKGIYPHTYNYDRLAFLCSSFEGPDPNLKAVGLRLIKHSPKDFYVVYYTITHIMLPQNKVDWPEALKLAQGLVTEYPNKPLVYPRLASVYYIMWKHSFSSEDAKNAIANYQKFLDIAPPGFEYRKRAQALIQEMQESTSNTPS